MLCRSIFAGGVILALAAGAAAAEPSNAPSFDCASARTPIEKLICSDPDLADLDNEMADAFRSMFHNLPQSERAGTLNAQRTWSRRIEELCPIEAYPNSSYDAVKCASKQYDDWLDWIDALAIHGVGPYTFVGRARMAWSGRRYWTYDCIYPRIVEPISANTKAFNEYVSSIADDECRPSRADLPDDDVRSYNPVPVWYQVSYTVIAGSARVIALEVNKEFYGGGAHPEGSRIGRSWLVKQQRPLSPEDIFINDNWIERTKELAVAAFIEEEKTKPTEEEENAITSTVSNFNNWLFGTEKATVVFNAYTFGSHIEPLLKGVDVPYSKLRGFLKPGGPIPPGSTR
jgi:uncharacterized protein